MRAKIRHTIPGHAIDDVKKAMRELTIDNCGTYREVLVVKEMGLPDAVREAFLLGSVVRQFIRIQLQDSMREVEQTEPTEIVLRAPNPTRGNRHRTQTCTYSQIC